MIILTERCRKLFPALMLIPGLLLAGCSSPEEKAAAHYKSGLELISNNDDIAARLELLKAIKYKSDMIEAWRALAGVDDRTKANTLFQDLRRVVELDPGDLQARLRMARLMIVGGAGDAALKLLSVVSDDDKPNAELHLLRSSIMLQSRDVAEAIREAQRAFEIDPASVDAISLLAAKRLSDGDADGALKLLDSAPESANGELRIGLQRTQIYATKGDRPKAEQTLRGLVGRFPQEVALRRQLVQLLLADKRFDDAETELRASADGGDIGGKAGLELVGFLLSVRGAEAARAELQARIKRGGDVFDYQLALAELDFGADAGKGAVQLQALAQGAKSAERKLLAQGKLAKLLLAKGDVPAASPILADMLAADRRNVTALRLRAAIRIEQGQFDDAIGDLREALNDQSKSTDLLLLLAAAYERSGKNELAQRQFAEALKASNRSPRIAVGYAGFLQRHNELDRAEEVLSEAASRSPGDVDLLSALGRVRLSRQNWSGAAAVADALSGAGSKAVGEQIRAAAFAGQNKPDQAIAALKLAHEAAPDAVQPVVSLISAYLEAGRAGDAESLLDEMVRKFPGNAQLALLMGQTQLAGNRTNDAERSFRKAIELQPNDASGYNALSDLYVRQRNFDAATAVLQSGLREQPASLNLRYAWAALLIQKGDPEGAIAQYEEILKTQPTALLAINNMVSLMLDFRADQPSIQRAMTLADNLKTATVPQFQDTYGWVLYKRGDFSTSVSVLEAAQAKLPKAASVHYHLGMSYAGTGQSDKAEAQLRTALELEPDGTPMKQSIRAALKQ